MFAPWTSACCKKVVFTSELCSPHAQPPHQDRLQILISSLQTYATLPIPTIIVILRHHKHESRERERERAETKIAKGVENETQAREETMIIMQERKKNPHRPFLLLRKPDSMRLLSLPIAALLYPGALGDLNWSPAAEAVVPRSRSVPM